jgi:hypothetical protein
MSQLDLLATEKREKKIQEISIHTQLAPYMKQIFFFINI